MNNIKKKRLELGYKQYKIAEELGISLRHYARIENNERKAKLSELVLLSNIFNCPIKELKGGCQNGRISKNFKRSAKKN